MNSQCVHFHGYKNDKGYGSLSMESKKFLAHRVSYRLHVGVIPKGMMVCHHCDNPSCINPKHLFLGTEYDNIMDAVNKKRQSNSRKTHCHNGHKFTVENTILYRGGRWRMCRACKRVRHLKYYHAERRKLAALPKTPEGQP